VDAFVHFARLVFRSCHEQQAPRCVRSWDERVPLGEMARGWESKAVESQQADAGRSKTLRPALTAAERETLEQRRGLELALARTEAELSAASRPAHRDMLNQRLQAIRDALAELA